MIKGKKGDATAVLLILIIFFFLAVSFLVVNYVGVELTWVMENTALNTTNASSEVVDGMQNITTNVIDNGMVIFVAFIIIGLVISSFLIRIHAVWLFLYIIFLAVAIFLAVFLGNAYQDITERTVFANAVANMPMTMWIMSHIVVIMLAAGALSMAVIFSKIYRGGGYVERI